MSSWLSYENIRGCVYVRGGEGGGEVGHALYFVFVFYDVGSSCSVAFQTPSGEVESFYAALSGQLSLVLFYIYLYRYVSWRCLETRCFGVSARMYVRPRGGRLAVWYVFPLKFNYRSGVIRRKQNLEPSTYCQLITEISNV